MYSTGQITSIFSKGKYCMIQGFALRCHLILVVSQGFKYFPGLKWVRLGAEKPQTAYAHGHTMN